MTPCARARFIGDLYGWLTSFATHATLLVVLGLMLVPADAPESPPIVIRQVVEEAVIEPAVLDLSRVEPPSEEAANDPVDHFPVPIESIASGPVDDVLSAGALPAEQATTRLKTPGFAQDSFMAPATAESIMIAIPRGTRGGSWDGRRADNRDELLLERGGTPESEGAVLRGLRWLAAHQHEDGAWWFNHQAGVCAGQCRNPGSFESTNAATALALLSFLGAGHTQKDGEFKDNIYRGLYYLTRRMYYSKQGGDFQEGSMYSQGLVAIAFCEAYAMTGDEGLRRYAQAALEFITNAQHTAGGWRYQPGQPGDMTVTGWQWMALKSGQMSNLGVNTGSLYKAGEFLDSLSSHDGARYGYTDRSPRPTTTAVGLLLRMYSGWEQDDPRLKRGVEYLSSLGPSKKNMYFNYYATQVMSHYDGPLWERWNRQMRNRLVREQADRGHEAGSWHYQDEHAEEGGRLYNTAMAVLTLEVYYRYLPLYTPRASD